MCTLARSVDQSLMFLLVLYATVTFLTLATACPPCDPVSCPQLILALGSCTTTPWIMEPSKVLRNRRFHNPGKTQTDRNTDFNINSRVNALPDYTISIESGACFWPRAKDFLLVGMTGAGGGLYKDPERDCPLGPAPDPCQCCSKGVCGLEEGRSCYNATVFKNLPDRKRLGVCASNMECVLRNDLTPADGLETVCICADKRTACGSDNQTYESTCKMYRVQNNKRVTLQYWGPCHQGTVLE
ncbi:Kazal type serine protease inhibitor [Homalodisca vitripennis]|nr:Kazal type serine protease inhibitor [Homalodisca vitripennis]